MNSLTFSLVLSTVLAVGATSNITTFWLYTRRNRDVPQRIQQPGDLAQLRSTNFDFNLPTWIGVHGWGKLLNATVYENIKNAYLDNWDVNVIGCDWFASSTDDYSDARHTMSEVADDLKDLLDFLKAGGYNETKINLVGFSLGAQALGIAAENTVGGFKGNIMAIDPPMWLFDLNRPGGRVSGDDAPYVEVMHTSMLGTPWPLGDVDFFVNAGWVQPGCTGDPFWLSVCSHFRALDVYERTIRAGPLVGRRCRHELQPLLGLGWTCGGIGEDVVMGSLMPKKWAPGVYSVLI